MNKKYLETLSLHELRSLGREYGVRRPSMKRKNEIITEMLQIKNGERAPHYTHRGRPSINNDIVNIEKPPISVEKFIKIEKALKAFNDEIRKILIE